MRVYFDSFTAVQQFPSSPKRFVRALPPLPPFRVKVEHSVVAAAVVVAAADAAAAAAAVEVTRTSCVTLAKTTPPESLARYPPCPQK